MKLMMCKRLDSNRMEKNDMQFFLSMNSMYGKEKTSIIIDPGDQILLKIQSSWNHFKSNGCIGLVIMNPTQLVWVQTDVR
jgi:hypothetical protein